MRAAQPQLVAPLNPSPAPAARRARRSAPAATAAASPPAPLTVGGVPWREWLSLQSPSRYLGNEWGSAHKPWADASVRFLLAYPEVYEVGASNLGHQLLYSCLNAAPGLLCDRSYLPAPDAQALLARHGAPLFAVESGRPFRHFHLVGLSLAYELVRSAAAAAAARSRSASSAAC